MKWYIQGLVFGYLSAPQRTGRQGRGLEMGDGHQEHSIDWVPAARSSLRLLFFFLEVCGSLGLGGAWLARTAVWVPSLWEVLVRLIVLESRVLENGSSRSTRPSARRVEFPLFGLDRVRWSSWSVWPWNSSSFSACCLLLPLARNEEAL
ncbi:unnamed protein product [Microthlaspi erraticum]|uniref:Uncharacterized protein n=1 Tax=Microthlaspi erraticum TaxID=1685480 RepID=A0A6D2KB84_9BRAS|nr:unnamed protein product [Microthlaspi erraticum]